ncbi:MAG: homogentisate 1,2-dioxygenase, partial [Acidimicrobiales bacterium]
NDDVEIAFSAADSPSPLYRSAVGDELVYVQSGTAVLRSSFGPLAIGPGDYVVVPAGVTHQWEPDGSLSTLVIQTRGHIGIPAKYLTPRGQLGEGAPFTERDIRLPGP